MYLFYFYVPESHLEEVKTAVFKAGGGKFKNYDQCCFETRGKGQFRPLENSNPYLGNKNRLEIVDEVKVELVCEASVRDNVKNALFNSHPYEEIAYGFIKIEN